MEEEVAALTGAASGENNPERATWRNGYRARAWKTRAGEVELPITQLRHGSYFPSFLTPRRLSEAALTSVIQGADVPGISMRNVDRLVPAMGLSGVKRSEVSRQSQELDTRVGSFLDRPLEGQWPFLGLDCYLRQGSGKRSHRLGGRYSGAGRQRPGPTRGAGTRNRLQRSGNVRYRFPSETAASWTSRRAIGNLRSPSRIGGCHSAHAGHFVATLPRALLASSSGSRQPRRASGDRKPGSHGFAFRQRASAQPQWGKFAEELRNRFPLVAQLRDEAESEVLAYLSYPESRHAEIYSANPIERLNQEIKRRSRTVEIFLCESAILHLIGALLMEQNDEWAVARSCLNLADLARVFDTDNTDSEPDHQ